MTQGHTIITRTGEQHVEVRLDDEVVAASDRPVLLEETGLPTRYYLPREDVTAEVRGIDLSTHCPFKGDASYWTIDGATKTHDGIAWSYETPKAGAEEIEGHLCFAPDRTELLVDGVTV